ncbi:HD domain-containing phosphohydrolase [Azotobacter salinestris]|uniref:HD domain-containing phosphohydrolase n=1 Tax=Azotobacter salinestris TaxID=69964 RepID=UPI001266A48F|nr:HD domain-containing phosphohydrolase [Azotobacter salinestris]
MLSENLRDCTIVVIEDTPANLRLVEATLRAFGLRQVKGFSSSAEGLAWLQENPWDLLLLDLDMPSPDGFEILQALSGRNRSSRPVLIVTALSDAPSRRRGLELGANDYLCKPVDLPELLLRVGNSLQLSQASQALQRERDNLERKVHERTRQLLDSHQAVVRSLCRAAEFKDSETGNHILRIGESAALLARALGQDEAWVENIRLAAPMHDIGKIGIPDRILGRPGQFSPEERDLMNRHPRIGHEILSDHHGSSMMQMAADIALHHHERWDGSGYPGGLEGEEIPLAARIVALCDVYDALRSERPYKPAWPVAKVQRFILENAGRQFDPQLVEVMSGLFPELERLHAEMVDERRGEQ